MFQGKRHLSWPPSGASICEIADIGEVVEGPSDILDVKGEKLDAAVVIGVHELEVYYLCLFCKKGSVEVKGGQGLGECRSCKTMQALRNQKISGKLYLESSGNKRVSVRANGDMLAKIVKWVKRSMLPSCCWPPCLMFDITNFMLLQAFQGQRKHIEH